MKLYICEERSHPKNVESIRKMCEHNGATYEFSTNLDRLNDTFDIVLCFNKFYPPSMFPANCKVVYGPQFFTFPDDYEHPVHKHTYEPERFFFNTLADWNLKIHSEMAPSLNLTFVPIPFGIDIDNIKIVPSVKDRNKVMVYTKVRHPSNAQYVFDFLRSRGDEYYHIQYGSYNETDFKNQLADTKFVIWIGSHESQGYAFQETLALNIPILLWEAPTMHVEFNRDNKYTYESYRDKYPLFATTANAWSSECGIKFYEQWEFETRFQQMNERIDSFTPRKFIESQLSLKAAYANLLKKVGL